MKVKRLLFVVASSVASFLSSILGFGDSWGDLRIGELRASKLQRNGFMGGGIMD